MTQAVRHRLDPTGGRFRAQTALQFVLGGGNEAAHRNHAMPSTIHGLGKRFLLGFHRKAPREAHGKAERRCKQRRIPHRAPAKRWIERCMADAGHHAKAIRVGLFPKSPRWISADVAPDGGQLAGGKGKGEPKALFPSDGGHAPRAPQESRRHTANALEPMGKIDGVERGVSVEIHDEQEMNVIRHDDSVGKCECRIGSMDREQPFQDFLSQRKKFGMCGLGATAIKETFPHWRAFLQPGKHRVAALHAEREEEKGTPPSGKVHLHTNTSRLFRLLS